MTPLPLDWGFFMAKTCVGLPLTEFYQIFLFNK
jgi:hypothetical protein